MGIVNNVHIQIVMGIYFEHYHIRKKGLISNVTLSYVCMYSRMNVDYLMSWYERMQEKQLSEDQKQRN